MKPDFDYLIVGQGIAGTCLAWHLLERNQRFLLVDSPTAPSSSTVAAGIFNPLTGRKLVKTWLADTLFPYAWEFYSKTEQKLGIRAQHSTDIFRPYRNLTEKENYLRWTADPEYKAYIAASQTDFSASRFIHAPHNGLSISRSGWLDLPHFLAGSRTYFRKLGLFQEAHFSSADLALEPNRVTWKETTFTKVINCMGIGAQNDPLFHWLPFNPVKGQILDCQIEGYDLDRIVNQGVFILPLANGAVRIGATYSWHDLDWETTEDARKYLDNKLMGLLKAPYFVQNQLAGIRPSTKDRRPFVGRHPEFGQLYIFNGLGTKGVTLAPFFAKQLVDLLLVDQEINLEANIARYFSLYSKPRMS